MDVLKYIPVAGVGMWFFEFIFLKRKLKIDRHIIMNNIQHHKKYLPNNPLWLLLFPEGTLNTPNNRVTSRAFAKKMDIPDDPAYVILPKATGVFMCADALMPKINTLFDITVGYGGLSAEQIPYYEYLVLNCFGARAGPKEIHMRIDQYDLSQLPGFDGKITQETLKGIPQDTSKESEAFGPVANARREAFNVWLRQRYMEKDVLMKEFYEKGKFETSGPVERWTVKPMALDWLLLAATLVSSVYLVPFYFRQLWHVVAWLLSLIS